jgi:hypothetical protein
MMDEELAVVEFESLRTFDFIFVKQSIPIHARGCAAS